MVGLMMVPESHDAVSLHDAMSVSSSHRTPICLNSETRLSQWPTISLRSECFRGVLCCLDARKLGRERKNGGGGRGDTSSLLMRVPPPPGHLYAN